ncbi:MAG: hypothetical protein KF760_25690 [Candidatus Eremiobacteraeota bacterium]|nr:hypothetical protein [Candidatus Eremiobacteraeota bacterium]MCW5866871.1 hypothetical protein [Candidatus Eremiobacteraeota bacterium]
METICSLPRNKGNQPNSGLAAFNTLCGALFGGPSRTCGQQLLQRPPRCSLKRVLALDWPRLSFNLPALAVLASEGLGVQARWAPVACLSV